MNYCGLKNCDVANGPGMRVSLFVSGCTNHCPGCFQPETWDFEYGQPFGPAAEQEILETQKGMIHACEEETSLVLALNDSLVDPIYKETKGNPGYPLEAENDGTLSTFHRMDMHTENGVMGNSYLASKEKGEKMVERMVKGMADVLCDDRLWEQRV